MTLEHSLAPSTKINRNRMDLRPKYKTGNHKTPRRKHRTPFDINCSILKSVSKSKGNKSKNREIGPN